MVCSWGLLAHGGLFLRGSRHVVVCSSTSSGLPCMWDHDIPCSPVASLVPVAQEHQILGPTISHTVQAHTQLSPRLDLSAHVEILKPVYHNTVWFMFPIGPGKVLQLQPPCLVRVCHKYLESFGPGKYHGWTESSVTIKCRHFKKAQYLRV